MELNFSFESSMTQLVRDLEATTPQVEKALRSTLSKMATWLRTKSQRGLSKELDVPVRQLRRRLKGFSAKNGGISSISLWYGLDPIALINLGAARQTRTGVTVGRRKIDGAFVASGKNGGRQVFKRRGKARLPLQKQSLEIDAKAEDYIENELIGAAEFEARFFKTFEHELKWRTQTRT